jgi:signal peptidase I
VLFDLQSALLLAAAVTGAIVLADKLKRKVRPEAPSSSDSERSLLIEYSRSLFPIVLAVLVLRSFVFEPFRIPSESMMPGLIDGDFIFVDKFSYGLRLPLTNSKLLSVGEPQRGDVIVFRSPADPSTNLIKRLVGLPGDHVVVRSNRLYINGSMASLRVIAPYVGAGPFDGSTLAAEAFGTTDHIVMFAPTFAVADFDGSVPAEHYFFMGDNRNDSEDSRFPKVGFVPARNLVGHARVVWLNWHLSAWARIGTIIR